MGIPIYKKSSDGDNVSENANNKAAKGSAAKDEIQLADILKPSTLIIALVTFVLIILLGWYVYVLKPALYENESMIHFMDTHHQDNIEQINLEKNTIKNINEKNLQPAPESSLATLSANEPSDTIEKNKIEQNKPTNKTVKSIKHKSHQHALKSAGTAQKTSRSGNSPKCTQAQIALHQCL